MDSELVKIHHQLGSLLNNGGNNVQHEERLIENSGLDETVQLIEKIDDISDSAINSCCFYDNDLLATGSRYLIINALLYDYLNKIYLTILLLSSDKMVRLFRIYDDGKSLEELQISPIDSHTYSINYVEFSSDGCMLATCSLDGCANIWNPIVIHFNYYRTSD